MSDPLHLTILYEEGDDGWIVSSIPEVPGVLSQDRTKDEAREVALDALASATGKLAAGPFSLEWKRRVTDVEGDLGLPPSISEGEIGGLPGSSMRSLSTVHRQRLSRHLRRSRLR